MLIRNLPRISLALAAAAVVASTPAFAQGRGNDKDKDRDKREETRNAERRPELQRRDQAAQADRDDDRDRDRDNDRDDNRDYRTNDPRYGTYQPNTGRRQGVPPGWCNGRGNPHNTVENCGYSPSRIDAGRYGTYGRTATSRSSNASYAAQHSDFHRYLDQKYARLAAQHPRDSRWLQQVQRQKQAEHDRWHQQMGR